jgi:hypothetical protein
MGALGSRSPTRGCYAGRHTTPNAPFKALVFATSKLLQPESGHLTSGHATTIRTHDNDAHATSGATEAWAVCSMLLRGLS